MAPPVERRGNRTSDRVARSRDDRGEGGDESKRKTNDSPNAEAIAPTHRVRDCQMRITYILFFGTRELEGAIKPSLQQRASQPDEKCWRGEIHRLPQAN
ncbi:MAG: hypothetical protein D6680_09905 [Cyanobacteria bacterium J007]|nr:MAG: hypothetical protein D6680_09905 [Cyanobacteria bacterium J007]